MYLFGFVAPTFDSRYCEEETRKDKNDQQPHKFNVGHSLFANDFHINHNKWIPVEVV